MNADSTVDEVASPSSASATQGIINLREAIAGRHSVRSYTDETVDEEVLNALSVDIAACNAASGLHMQMVSGVEDALSGCRTHYGRFQHVHNAIALIGNADCLIGRMPPHGADRLDGVDDSAAPECAPLKTSVGIGTNVQPRSEEALHVAVGYFGAYLSLRIVQLGLATSWTVLDGAADGWWKLEAGERAVWFLTFGYGARPGAKRHSKSIEQLCRLPQGMTVDTMPGWFRRGVQAATLAPTSLNRQPFVFTLHDDGSVSAEATDGLFAYVGLGCAICHFEIGAGWMSGCQCLDSVQNTSLNRGRITAL